jgi:hypothetical protein
MRERATSRLSRQMIRLSENSARTEPHASCSPFSAATASASKTSACGSGCLPREMTGCPGPWQITQPAPAALVGEATCEPSVYTTRSRELLVAAQAANSEAASSLVRPCVYPMLPSSLLALRSQGGSARLRLRADRGALSGPPLPQSAGAVCRTRRSVVWLSAEPMGVVHRAS